MKKMFKKIIGWFNRQIVWFCNRRVLDAINNGATYEEICKIVEEEVNR